MLTLVIGNAVLGTVFTYSKELGHLVKRTDKGDYQHVVLRRDLVKVLDKEKQTHFESYNDVIRRLLQSSKKRVLTLALDDKEVTILHELHARLRELEASRRKNKRSGKAEAEQAGVIEKVLTLVAQRT